MRVCVYGAGATGGNMAVRLALAGHAVSVVARGAHLAAIREKGLTLLAGEERATARVTASEHPGELGEQDLVVVAVKATGLGAVAAGLAPLVGPGTRVLFPQNGIPWWYALGQPEGTLPPLPGFRLAEPILRAVPAERILGGTIFSANALAEPGVISNATPGANRLDFAEVAGPPGSAEPIRAAFRAAGIAAPDPGDARRAVWKKLMGNMSGSVLALATGTRSNAVRSDAGLSVIYARIVAEGLAIAAAHGHDLRAEVDAGRMMAALAPHKPSLLQDYELRRPMEIAEIVLAPVAFARKAGVPTPTLDAIAAVASRLAAERGLFDPAAVAGLELWGA